MRKIYIIILMLSISILFCSCEKGNPNYKEFNMDSEYELEYSNSKVISKDYDYIFSVTKEKNKDFIILNLTDIQLNSFDYLFNNKNVRIMKETINTLIEKVKPDLITITGDITYGEKKPLVKICEYIDSFNIPFCPVFGNHDNEERQLTIIEQIEVFKKYNNCIISKGPDNLGSKDEKCFGNYIVNIIEEDDLSFKVVKTLIFANTGDNDEISKDEYSNEKPINSNDYSKLTDNQVEWYSWAVKSVQKYGYNDKVTSALFIHIPIYEYYIAARTAYKNSIPFDKIKEFYEYVSNITIEDSKKSTTWNEGYESSIGVMREKNCTFPYDDKVFERITFTCTNSNETYIPTDLVIAGHDHINNFIINYKNVKLIYSLKTGTGSYNNNDLNGGTVITINSNTTNVYHEYVEIK